MEEGVADFISAWSRPQNKTSAILVVLRNHHIGEEGGRGARYLFVFVGEFEFGRDVVQLFLFFLYERTGSVLVSMSWLCRVERRECLRF